MSKSKKTRAEYTPAILIEDIGADALRAIATAMMASTAIQSIKLSAFHYPVTREEIFAAVTVLNGKAVA